jgi:ferredoxin
MPPNTRKAPIWTPPPELAAKMPAHLSGNTVNGEGETATRRPTPIMWHHPKLIPDFAEIQEVVNRTYIEHPVLGGMFTTPDRKAPPAAIAPEREEDTAESWTRRVKEFALANEADLVGIAPVDPDSVFEGFEVTEPTIVVLGVEMKHAELSKAPEVEAAVEVATQYNRGNRAARTLADWIRQRGWQARGHGGPGAGPVALIPNALNAGLGELGKHGSIINRTYGSSFRLAGVLTDLPLVMDAPDVFGADDFCLSCQVCSNACPPDAIHRDKVTVRGVEKWYVDFDKCMPYFATAHGCGVCIAVCPWSKPGTAPSLAQRMSARRARRDGGADDGH